MARVVALCLASALLVATYVSAGSFGPAPNQDSGYIDIPETSPGSGGSIFYWYFGNEKSNPNAPTVLWLTGGPGCSSELAVMFEQGPYRVNETTGEITSNPGRWSQSVNMIFVDQPVGTGFSIANSSEYVKNEKEVGHDMLIFLQSFFSLPQFQQLQQNDFFITGESYAGHYVPAISWAVYNSASFSEIGASSTAKQKVAGVPVIKLRGFAIGNGLVNPPVQYNDYGPFAYDNKLISLDQYASINGTLAVCEGLIKDGLNPIAVGVCNSIIGDIQAEAGGINPYNIRLKCGPYPLCYNFKKINDLLNDAKVQQQLGVRPDAQWTSCNMEVHADLMGDWLTNLEVNIPTMLDKGGLRVLVYSGRLDFICNWYGGRDWTRQMQWSGQQQFDQKMENMQTWTVNGGAAGTFATQGNMTFLSVYDAGHMVPHDQPMNALAMLQTFVSGGSYGQ